MKKIILSLVVCSLFTFGDIVDDYQSEGMSAYRAGDYPKALRNLQSALEIQLKTLAENSKDIATSYNNIGEVYQSMGDYPKALEYLQKALITFEKVLGKEHEDTASSYNNIGVLYYSTGNYRKALEYHQKALVIREKVLGKEHEDTASSYNNIGENYRYIGDYPKALEYLQKALVIREKIFGKEHRYTVRSYNNIGVLYKTIRNYTKALGYHQKALAIDEKILGGNHPITATDYNNVASLYFYIGDYPKALEYHQKALAIREKVLGKEHPDTAQSYNNIGEVYRSMGDHPKALEYLQKALIIFEKVLGKEHEDTASSYNNIGGFYSSIGNYPKALKYHQKSLAISKKVLGLEHPNTALSYNNIGSVYDSMGDYPKALEYHQKALDINEKVLGAKHPDTAMSYNNIGLVYHNMGDYSKELEYHQKALDINEKVLGKVHINTATSYNNIGEVYRSMGDYPKALEYHQKALIILEKVLGKVHLSTAMSYNNIGLVYHNMGDYSKELEYLQKALAIDKKVLDKEHPYIGTSYNNIGENYRSIGNYPKALEYHQKALAISEKVLGKEHINTATSYNNIGSVYSDMGDYPKVYSYLKKSFDSFLSQRDTIFAITDTQGKEAFMKQNFLKSDFLLKSAYNYAKTTPSKKEELKSDTFNDWLNVKGSVYDSENVMVTLYENTTDNSIKELIDSLNSKKRAFAKLNQDVLFSTKNLESYNAKIKTLQDEISKIEVSLSSKVSSYQDEMKLRTISYKDVSKYLKEGELYIDFAYINGIKEYMVFAIDEQNSIQWFEIDEKDTKTINDNIEALRKEMVKISKPNKISSDEMNILNLSSKAKLQNIYKLLLEKTLGSSLKNTHSLVISADGLLRLLPFEALYDGSNYLIEKKEVRYIPSGKEFVRLNRHINKTNKTAVLIENPSFDYDIVSKKNMQTINTPNTHLTKDATIDTLKRGNFIKLNTHDVNWTNSSFENTKIIKYDKNNATEANLINSTQPRILHLSTHGFFINDESIKNPMLKSGIALAGANKYAKNGTGIVTALKLSGLDLEGTDLVVLSACETGEVDANSTESISGLNKAFIQAGSDNVMVSLWSVKERETALLMSDFYANLSQKKSVSQSLKESKLKMIKQHPYFWAGFVLNGSGI